MDGGLRRCSFCGKPQGEVRLIAGPGVYICNLCVALCNEILAHDASPDRPGPQDQPPAPSKLVRTEIISG